MVGLVAGLLLPPAVASQVGALDPRVYACEADRYEEGLTTNDHLGHSLSVGDWNGDGFDDFVSGSLVRLAEIPGQGQTSGKAWIFLGNAANAPSVIPAVTITDISIVGDVAPAVAFIGDVDGDGGDDLAIGAVGHGNHQLGDKTGVVWIFLSNTDPNAMPMTISTSSADLLISPPVSLWSSGDQPHFGYSIAPAGDLNQDGWGDLIIGAPGPLLEARIGQQPGDPDYIPPVYGRALVYHGTPQSGWSTGPGFTYAATLDGGMTANDVGNRFGWSVAAVGDVDGDTFGDIAVGAIEAGATSAINFDSHGTGFVNLYFGAGAAGLSAPHRIAPVDPAPMVGEPTIVSALFGFTIAGGVDLNDIVGPDILIGCPYYSIADNLQGAVYAYTFTPTRAQQDAYLSVQPAYPSAVVVPPATEPFLDESGRFGWSLAAMGQYDPGTVPATRQEFLVGAFVSSNPSVSMPMECMNDPQGGRQSGRVYIVSVPPNATTPTVQAYYRGEQGVEGGRMRLGTTVAVGDFDGDDYPDALVGGSGYATSAVSEAGRVYFFSNFTAP